MDKKELIENILEEVNETWSCETIGYSELAMNDAIKIALKNMENHMEAMWHRAYEQSNDEILEIIEERIEYFRKPETEMNKAVIFLLEDLKSKIGKGWK